MDEDTLRFIADKESLHENAKKVTIDIEFTRIGEIDTVNEKYYVELEIRSSWNIDEIIHEYDKNRHWNPEIFIENSFYKAEEVIKYETSIDQHQTTKITEKRIVKGYLWEKMEIQNFPHDIQELSVVLSSQRNEHEVKLVANTYQLGRKAMATFVEQQKWKLMSLIEASSHASYDTESTLKAMESPSTRYQFESWINRPIVVFKAFTYRRPGFYYANAFFLIFLITIVSISTFGIDRTMIHNRIQSTLTILLTSVSFKWVINRTLPAVNYVTSLDLYSILNIIFLCVLCAAHAFIGHFSKYFITKEIDLYIMIGFIGLFILLHVLISIKMLNSYILVWNIEKRSKEYLKSLKSELSTNI